MPITLNGTTGINNSNGGYTGDGISFADGTPANTLVTDSSGNVGIGTSSPSQKLDVSGTSRYIFSVGNAYTMQTSLNAAGSAFADDYKNALSHIWQTSGTERMRIDTGGRLIVGGTSPPYSARVGSYPVSQYGFAAQQVTSVNGSYNYLSDCSLFGGIGYHFLFLVGGSTVGTITSNGTTATYATSSDYRLKESVTPMTGALAKNELLNPVTYKWKVDGSDGQGFIAHELQAIFPDAVVGEKDGVDAEGNPQYQGVDTSFLVGHLVACVKELKAELDSVKAELAALKSA